MKMDEALTAIKARQDGVFDNPVLMSIGPLGRTDDDVRLIKRRCLEDYGYTVGLRNPQINTDFDGKFMVVENFDDHELPTKNGSNGPWCIVGDDLDTLIDKAFDDLDGMLYGEYR